MGGITTTYPVEYHNWGSGMQTLLLLCGGGGREVVSESPCVGGIMNLN